MRFCQFFIKLIIFDAFFNIFLHIFALFLQTKNMKKVFYILILLSLCTLNCFTYNPSVKASAASQNPKIAIVIDDFGSFDQSGVEKLLNADCTLTCAVLPFVDNTELNIMQIKEKGHEIILHMPMQSHVNLPESWYGPVYISRYEPKDVATQKLEKCLSQFENIKGFNIHIGSGVSQNKELMKTIYDFAKNNGLYFLDSRTIETKATEEACKETNSIYLGRDVFLEADKNRSYNGVLFRIEETMKIAKEKGYAVAIGHVGAEGGENTAQAIIDSITKIKSAGIDIVPLSEIYHDLKINISLSKCK